MALARPPHPRRTASASHALIAILLLLSPFVAAASDRKPKPLDPCTVRSPSSNAFFDLNPIAKHPATEKELRKHRNDAEPYVARSWHARGYDYGANFTLNFCAGVVEPLDTVEGVDSRLWRNVSAFYDKGGRKYSIGQLNTQPVFRGRKLVLNYTDGSPCPGSSPSFLDRRSARGGGGGEVGGLLPHEAEDLEKAGARRARPFWADHDDDDDDDRDDDDDDDDDWRGSRNGSTSHDGVRRKSSILSLHCEKDPLAPKAGISFVGSMDHCTYFFEVRTLAACAGVEAADQSLGPGGVFGVIAIIAFMVYIVGGCVYQRHVLNQRGWRQLPNYSLWASIAGAFKDCLIVLTSSCTRFLPSRKGYRPVGANGGYGRGRGRGSDSDMENRLIDQLDEEWDD